MLDLKKCNIFIGSPGDVVRYKDKIEHLIELEGSTICENVIIKSYRYENDAPVTSYKKPQDIINEEVLEKCDILIALFHSKIGTPTVNYRSGTIEEVEYFLKRKKPVIFYFIDELIHPSEITESTLTVQKIKQEYGAEHTYRTINGIEEINKYLTIDLKYNIETLLKKENSAFIKLTCCEKNGRPDIKAINQDSRLKLLLVKTNIDFYVKNHDFGIPLGLWVLKSYFELRGLDIVVDIFDERYETISNSGIKFEDVALAYDICAISLSTCEVVPAIKKFEFLTKNSIVTIAGGIFTASNELYLLKKGCVDYVIPGVSTLPFYNLLVDLKKSKEDGISLKSNILSHIRHVFTSKNINNTNIWKPSQLPNIEIGILREMGEQYYPYMNRKVDIFTSRGCNKKCEFCSVQKESQQQIFERDSSYIIDEIRVLYDIGFRQFSFKDEDFFMLDRARLMKALKKLKEQGVNAKYKIRTRVDSLLSGTVDLEELSNAGIYEIQYGIETPNNEFLSKIKKGNNYDYNSVIDLIRKNSRYNIITNCSFILGIEGETTEYYEKLLGFFRSIHEDTSIENELFKPYINFITPHPYKNSISDENYKILTYDLRYFNHKIPVCYPKYMKRIYRKNMIDTYHEIVKLFNAEQYNPLIPESISKQFISGSLYPTDNNTIQFSEVQL